MVDIIHTIIEHKNISTIYKKQKISKKTMRKENTIFTILKKKILLNVTNRIVSHKFWKTKHVFDELKIKLKIATNVVETIYL
jgi:hypothetical protein